MALFDSIRLGSSAAGDYEIERSLRFNDGDSPNLFREGGSEGNRRTFTLSVWIKRSSRGEHSFWDFYTNDSNRTIFQLYFGNLRLFSRVGGSTQISCSTNLELRDFSAWYHFVYAVDTTQGTQANRVKMYINGVQQTVSGTLPSQNADTFVGSTNENRIGCQHDSAGNEAFFDGYMAEFNYIDGQQLTPSSFAETDTTTGEYKAIKYTGSYGTRGYYLNFSDNSGTTATTLGKDSSGNGHNFTPNNFSVAAGAGNDSLEDTPTNNFCIWNPLSKDGGTTLSNGNLDIASSNYGNNTGTFFLTSGKWYWEGVGNGYVGAICGNDGQNFATSISSSGSKSIGYWEGNGYAYWDGGNSGSGTSYSTSDVIGIALDMDNGTVKFYKNNTLIHDLTFGSGTIPDLSAGVFPVYNNGTISTSKSVVHNFGQRAFSYTPPTGYKKICSANLPDPSIKLPNKHFGIILYTGNDADNRNVTDSSAIDFTPDFVWQKSRNSTNYNLLFDSVRGATKILVSNTSDAEATQADSLSAFITNGFTVSDNTAGADMNSSSHTYVAWNWKGGGTASSNSDGTITTSISANPSAGFSAVKYTGNGTSGATVGHGLGIAPKVYIIKETSGGTTTNWRVYHHKLNGGSNPEQYQIVLNASNAEEGKSDIFNDTAPTSTVFSIGNHVSVNANNEEYICYVFSEVAGYSKFGSYTGNGSSDGTFVFTGFRPAVIIVKRSSATQNWLIFDNKRGAYNPDSPLLYPNLSNAEDANTMVDFVSNGFKWRAGNLGGNDSGSTFIYLAFAESPFKYSRAR